jgi:hypothetical protein
MATYEERRREEWAAISEEAHQLVEDWINGNHSSVIERLLVEPREAPWTEPRYAILEACMVMDMLRPRDGSFLRRLVQRLIDDKLEAEDREEVRNYDE